MSLKVPFVTIINTDAFYVEASVEEGDIVKVKNGQAVHISFDAIESLTLTGKVVYVNEKADIDENEIVSYGVEVLFANTDPRIRDGLTASVDFITKEVNGVLTIPVQSVKNRNGKATVVLENRKIREVVTGFTDGKMVEAIS